MIFRFSSGLTVNSVCTSATCKIQTNKQTNKNTHPVGYLRKTNAPPEVSISGIDLGARLLRGSILHPLLTM